jgi:large subunit ribosomal protein L33
LRIIVTLACVETGDRDYTTTKNKKSTPERLELMKYSPRLRRHALYRETK